MEISNIFCKFAQNFEPHEETGTNADDMMATEVSDGLYRIEPTKPFAVGDMESSMTLEEEYQVNSMTLAFINQYIIMKNKFFITLVSLFIACFFVSCNINPYERELKKSVKTYLRNNLKDPDSLKDLKICYATLTKEELDNALEKWPVIDGKNQHSSHYGKTEDIVVIECRAKNSFGGYVFETMAFNYLCRVNVYPLSDYEQYMVKALLSSPNKKIFE